MAMDNTHKDRFFTCVAHSICAIGLAIIQKNKYPAVEMTGFNEQIWPWLEEVELREMLYHVDLLQSIWCLTEPDLQEDVTQLMYAVIQDANLTNF